MCHYSIFWSCRDQNREALDADLFMEHCPKNVPITHVDCSPWNIYFGSDQKSPHHIPPVNPNMGRSPDKKLDEISASLALFFEWCALLPEDIFHGTSNHYVMVILLKKLWWGMCLASMPKFSHELQSEHIYFMVQRSSVIDLRHEWWSWQCFDSTQSCPCHKIGKSIH